MSESWDPPIPYRRASSNAGTVDTKHTDPGCPFGKRISNAVPVGNVDDLELCTWCRGDFEVANEGTSLAHLLDEKDSIEAVHEAKREA